MSQKWKVKGKGYYMFLTFSDNSLGKVVGIALNMHTHYEETVAWSFHVLVRYANSYVSYALLSFEVQVVDSHVSLMVSCILRSNPWGFQQEAGQRIGNEAEVNSISRRAKLWKNLSRQSSFNKIGQQGQRCPWSPWLKKRCIRCIQFIRCIGSIFWRHGLLMSSSKLNDLTHRGWNVFALVTTFVLVALHVFMSTSQLALVSNISEIVIPIWKKKNTVLHEVYREPSTVLATAFLQKNFHSSTVKRHQMHPGYPNQSRPSGTKFESSIRNQQKLIKDRLPGIKPVQVTIEQVRPLFCFWADFCSSQSPVIFDSFLLRISSSKLNVFLQDVPEPELESPKNAPAGSPALPAPGL